MNKYISKNSYVFLSLLRLRRSIDAGLILRTNGLQPVVDVKNIRFDQGCFYPNPAKDKIHFSGLGNDQKTVEIYTSLSVLVLQTKVLGETVDVSGLSEYNCIYHWNMY